MATLSTRNCLGAQLHSGLLSLPLCAACVSNKPPTEILSQVLFNLGASWKAWPKHSTMFRAASQWWAYGHSWASLSAFLYIWTFSGYNVGKTNQLTSALAKGLVSRSHQLVTTGAAVLNGTSRGCFLQPRPQKAQDHLRTAGRSQHNQGARWCREGPERRQLPSQAWHSPLGSLPIQTGSARRRPYRLWGVQGVSAAVRCCEALLPPHRPWAGQIWPPAP